MVHFRFTYARFYVCKTVFIGYNDGLPLLSLNISSQKQKARSMVQSISVTFIIYYLC